MRRSLMLLAAAACAQAPGLSPPEPATWERPFVWPALDGPLFDRHPELRDRSRFTQEVAGAARPDAAHRGAFGVGNGRAFAIGGLTDPLNTLHNIAGPRYRFDGHFWGDSALRLERDGAPVDFEQEWIGRQRAAPVNITRAVAGAVQVYTVDFAPLPAGVDPFEVPPVLVRLVQVLGGDATLVIDAWDPVEPLAGGVVAVDAAGRRFAHVGIGRPWTDGRLTVADGETVALALVFGQDQAGLDSALAAVAAADPERWLEETLDELTAWTTRGPQVETDDVWLQDWLQGIPVMLRSQMTPSGGVSPMSRYAGLWLRDTIGPVRYWLRTGQHEAAQGALDDLLRCHAQRGDIGNSCNSGLLPSEIPPEPDWGALPPFSGRTAAEGPSHLPIMYCELARWTGDHSAIDERWSYLRRSVLAQTVSPEGLQPWSGDETFRLAMNVAFDQAPEVPWQDIAWSSNSSYLMLAAADCMAAEARRRGEDPQAWTDLHGRVRAGLEAFWRPEGHWAAVLLKDPEAEPLDAPFEDASLMALWSGGMSPEDPQALSNLQRLLEVAGHPDGSVQSPPAPRYAVAGTQMELGAATGMIPGYTLDNLLQTGHPLLVPAFDQLFVYASPSGQYDEAVAYVDRAALAPVYDRGGTLGDVSARYRPWEGGINAAAAWRWLLGDGIDEEGVLHLAPRAPGGLPDVAIRGLEVRGVMVDVERRWTDERGWSVLVTTDAPLTVQVDIPLQVWEDVAVRLDGPAAGRLVQRPLGERVARFEPAPVDGTAEWSVGSR